MKVKFIVIVIVFLIVNLFTISASAQTKKTDKKGKTIICVCEKTVAKKIPKKAVKIKTAKAKVQKKWNKKFVNKTAKANKTKENAKIAKIAKPTKVMKKAVAQKITPAKTAQQIQIKQRNQPKSPLENQAKKVLSKEDDQKLLSKKWYEHDQLIKERAKINNRIFALTQEIAKLNEKLKTRPRSAVINHGQNSIKNQQMEDLQTGKTRFRIVPIKEENIPKNTKK